MYSPLVPGSFDLPSALYLTAVTLQAAQQNPAALLIWLFGLPGGIALLTLIAKGIFFIGKASTKLDQWDSLAQEFKEYRHTYRNYAQSVDLSLMVVETDVNAIQQHLDLPVRTFPDRRVGPSDRRQT